MKLISKKTPSIETVPGGATKVGKNSSMMRSIKVASLGFLLALRSEKSVRRIFICGASAVLICVFLGAGYLETTFLAFAWMICMTFEIFNTALEKAMDYACGKEYHPLIKKGKDFAGASVFIASSFALVLSLVIILNSVTWHVQKAL